MKVEVKAFIKKEVQRLSAKASLTPVEASEVDAIKKLNNLTSNTLSIGQTLSIPTMQDIEEVRQKEYPSDLVEKSVDKLVNQGYLNDRFYAKCFISNQMITSVYGPLKIQKELLEKTGMLNPEQLADIHIKYKQLSINYI